MTVVIGLTGSIATGKSTVSKMLKELGLPIVDADQISRDVVEPGEVAYQKIVKTFGKEILFEDETINRKQLGSIVFGNEEKRKQLNEIVHPEVRRQMLSQRDQYIQQGYRGVVLDIPLLFESKLTHFVDKIVVVYVNEETQLERLMNRDQSTKEEASQRINSQIPVEEKAAMADAVINNNGTRSETKEQLLELLQKWEII
ncbi:dephospho-CoA kinase [Salinibacillus xinjiangensis]|uniref:Dephospho-CoA kinase n=1 Tax=Salinibacillus xinjiangensis TaxID=1229268 RepID=A0A6G1XA56_9BACI|nr:dephospho-CoA kinase [Salinibacillus xinjiangensis]MRG87668.1 dephospho-CoA kinase [Salinibacillus xinjiangensis]